MTHPGRPPGCGGREQHRVLLVEDSELSREITLALLEAEGFHVDWAKNGREAVARAEARQYDLILMDVQMPVMTGLEATRRIRRLPGYERTPILAVTANDCDDQLEVCRNAGMNDQVPKLGDRDTLRQRVLGWLPEAPALDHHAPAPLEQSALAEAQQPYDVLRAALENIDGVSPEIGLRAASNRMPLYVQLLTQFCDRHARDMTRVEEQMQSGDRDAAKLTVHSLKGVAGALGMTEIEHLAATLDRAIKQHHAAGALRVRVRMLRDSLQQVVTELERVLTDIPSSGTPIAASALSEGLGELQRLLETDDANACDVFGNLERSLLAVNAPLAKRLKAQINGFAYSEALKTLDELETWL